MVNKYLYISALIVILLSLGCSNSEPSNSAPTIPLLVFPSNGQLCISNTLNFQWKAATDADKDPITYQLQIATDNQFTQIVNDSELPSLVKSLTLDKGKAYYWRVKAMDSNTLSSNYSGVFSFYTEGTALSNHLPFLPQLVAPIMDALVTGTAAELQWTALDVDNQDVLSYDIYLGTNSTPTTKVGNNIGATSLQVSTLQTATIYYWKVVVKDNHGGETIGPVWSFKTN